MKYVGSKRRIIKHILPIILQDREPDQWYVEPFVGGCNSIDKVTGNRIGADINEYLIAMWLALQNGWQPPKTLSFDQYKDIKNNQNFYDSELVGFVGIGCSYAGKWFGGFARGNDSFDNPRNYVDESRRNILKQLPYISDVRFYATSYDKLYIPKNSIVYCDPPYANSTKYGAISSFDHDNFWDWVRYMSRWHTVYVSEYEAPTDFECVWSKEIISSLDLDTGNKRNTEKLFRLR